MVAYQAEKTPTAAAQGLIQRMLSFESDLEYTNTSIINQIQQKDSKRRSTFELVQRSVYSNSRSSGLSQTWEIGRTVQGLQLEVLNLVSDNKLKVHKLFNDIHRAEEPRWR